MEKIETTKYGICVESDFFSAEATLLCGQVFRFFPTGEGFKLDDGEGRFAGKGFEPTCDKNWSAGKGFELISGDKKRSAGKGFELISGDKKCFVATVGSRTEIITNHIDYFCHYFDLGTDYGQIVGSLSGFDELKPALEKGRGIHILKQQLFETIISFIITANNNIPRIQGIIERLCANYGEKMDGFYAFPTAENLRDVTAEDYKKLGTGYRAEYLQSSVQTILDGDILERLPALGYQDAQKLLKTLKGVGQKVADCVCLFGLGLVGCYPTDTWIKQAEGCGSAAEARQKGMDRYGSLAGYAQQYKFYYQMSRGKY